MVAFGAISPPIRHRGAIVKPILLFRGEPASLGNGHAGAGYLLLLFSSGRSLEIITQPKVKKHRRSKKMMERKEEWRHAVAE